MVRAVRASGILMDLVRVVFLNFNIPLAATRTASSSSLPRSIPSKVETYQNGPRRETDPQPFEIPYPGR